MRAEYFPMYGSLTNKRFDSGPYFIILSENILSIKFIDIFRPKWRG